MIAKVTVLASALVDLAAALDAGRLMQFPSRWTISFAPRPPAIALNEDGRRRGRILRQPSQ
jgi:hypothetical protein